MRAIAEAGGNFLAFGQFVGEDVNTRVVTFKVNGLAKDKVKKVITDIVTKIWDIREM